MHEDRSVTAWSGSSYGGSGPALSYLHIIYGQTLPRSSSVMPHYHYYGAGTLPGMVAESNLHEAKLRLDSKGLLEMRRALLTSTKKKDG